jgi:hypothetical protein
MIQAGKPVPRVIAAFEKTGILSTGVEYGGGVHREFTVGPLTVAAELAAEAAMPDWIDPNLLFRFAVLSLDEKERMEAGLAPQALTEDEKRKASRMAEARWRCQVMHRVTRLGGIPPADIPEAVLLLLADDLRDLLTAAREVDASVERFRGENAGGVDAGRAHGPNESGNAVGSVNPL